MPTELTIFGAKYLIVIAALVAAALLVVRLWPRPRLALLHWALAATLLLGVSYALAQLGGAVYSDPRPFVSGHVHPLLAHAPDNGFPSDHALFATALVGLVALVDIWWSLPIALLAVLIDWARVGAGVHHLTDVVGSSVMVALALLLTRAVTPRLLSWLRPHVPAAWERQRLLRFPARVGQRGT